MRLRRSQEEPNAHLSKIKNPRWTDYTSFFSLSHILQVERLVFSVEALPRWKHLAGDGSHHGRVASNPLQ